MKYRSRINILLFILTFGVLFFPLLDGKDIFARSIIAGINYLFITLTCLLLYLKITYTIADNALTIRVLGFKMATIDIMRIKRIKRSYNPLSAPAASLKRLEIQFYKDGKPKTALISPVREAEFLEKLKEINPNIEIQVVQKRNILRFWEWDI